MSYIGSEGKVVETVPPPSLNRVLDIQLLYLIHKGPVSGYDLRRRMHSVFNVRLSYGTIYPHLRRFEAEGLVAGAWSPRTASTKKKMYLITEKGSATLRLCLTWFGSLGKDLGL